MHSLQNSLPDSLYHGLTHWAQLTPEQPFIIEAESGEFMTYQQCLVAVKAICQQLGETPKHLFLSIPNGIPNALIWLSAFVGGHTLVPMAPDSSLEDRRRASAMFHPDIIFVEEHGTIQNSSHARVISRAECENWYHSVAACGWEPKSAQSEGQVCIMTSGTTGEPKGVVLQEHQVMCTAQQVCAVHQLTDLDRGLTVLPFFHVNAPVVSLCSSLIAGSTIVIARRFSRRQFWSWIEQYKITWASIVPTIVAILLESEERPSSLLHTLRFARTGSAPLPAAHLKAFEQRFGVPLIETYGLSEAASMIVANPLPPAQHKPGSTGLPVGVELRICQPVQPDAQGGLKDVMPGTIGEVCVKGPAIIHAYYGNTDAQAFVQGWFRTGDLGYLDQDGYLFLVGRMRAVINRGGENIAPRDIEEVVQLYPDVQEAVAVGRPDSIYGEQVVVYFTVRGEWTEEGTRGLYEYAKHHLSPSKVPVDYIVVDELPKNRMGKVDRNILKAREEELFRVVDHTDTSNGATGDSVVVN